MRESLLLVLVSKQIQNKKIKKNRCVWVSFLIILYVFYVQGVMKYYYFN